MNIFNIDILQKVTRCFLEHDQYSHVKWANEVSGGYYRFSWSITAQVCLDVYRYAQKYANEVKNRPMKLEIGLVQVTFRLELSLG